MSSSRFSLLHQIDFFYNGLSQADQDSLNSAAGGNLMTRNTQEAFITIENKAKVRTCRNKPQVSSSGGTLTQIDAITTLTKQVEALEYHISSMRETYDQNQEAAIQLMQNQSTPLVPPPETPPLYTPKPKENLEPNPYQQPIPCPSRLQNDKFQALENPTRRVDHFVYRIDIIDGVSSFTRKFTRLLINNFMIDKCHILSEISLKIESSVSFHPKDKEIRGESS
ncbi:hypothetical protein Tco_1441838 [Tanacetum coccineum]